MGARQLVFLVEARLRAFERIEITSQVGALEGSGPCLDLQTAGETDGDFGDEFTSLTYRHCLEKLALYTLRTWLTYNGPSGNLATPGSHPRWQRRLGLVRMSMRTFTRKALANRWSFETV